MKKIKFYIKIILPDMIELFGGTLLIKILLVALVISYGPKVISHFMEIKDHTLLDILFMFPLALYVYSQISNFAMDSEIQIYSMLKNRLYIYNLLFYKSQVKITSIENNSNEWIFSFVYKNQQYTLKKDKQYNRKSKTIENFAYFYNYLTDYAYSQNVAQVVLDEFNKKEIS